MRYETLKKYLAWTNVILWIIADIGVYRIIDQLDTFLNTPGIKPTTNVVTEERVHHTSLRLPHSDAQPLFECTLYDTLRTDGKPWVVRETTYAVRAFSTGNRSDSLLFGTQERIQVNNSVATWSAVVQYGKSSATLTYGNGAPKTVPLSETEAYRLAQRFLDQRANHENGETMKPGARWYVR